MYIILYIKYIGITKLVGKLNRLEIKIKYDVVAISPFSVNLTQWSRQLEVNLVSSFVVKSRGPWEQWFWNRHIVVKEITSIARNLWSRSCECKVRLIQGDIHLTYISHTFHIQETYIYYTGDRRDIQESYRFNPYPILYPTHFLSLSPTQCLYTSSCNFKPHPIPLYVTL